VLGKFTGEDKSDTGCGQHVEGDFIECGVLTRFGSPGMKWWTSYCMRRAWRPQLQHARRCLRNASVFWLEIGGVWSSIPLTKEFRIDIARLEIPVSGWTCLRTKSEKLVDVLGWKTRLGVDVEAGADWSDGPNVANAAQCCEKDATSENGPHVPL
jgi:hypothetical protein